MFPDLLPTETSAGSPPTTPRTTTPALFSPSEHAERRFWEFFTAHVRNRNTRLAYLAAVRRFAEWCERRGVALDQIEPMVVAAYIEQLSGVLAPASVKQHLAALRMLFDWFVVGQVLPFNPANSVRGPRHVVKTGKTPVLSASETRALLDGIDVSTVVGLRDRAFLGVLVYSFARVGAAVSLRVADYYTQGPRSFFRLHEKGGRYNVVPAHHTAQAYVDAYLIAAGIGEDRRGPLFRSCEPGRRDALQDGAMSRLSALKMIKRRARKAGLPAEICVHRSAWPRESSDTGFRCERPRRRRRDVGSAVHGPPGTRRSRRRAPWCARCSSRPGATTSRVDRTPGLSAHWRRLRGCGGRLARQDHARTGWGSPI